jgi:hypothetical protein
MPLLGWLRRESPEPPPDPAPEEPAKISNIKYERRLRRKPKSAKPSQDE